jgi:hypothetical protein
MQKACHAPVDPAGSWAFKNEEGQDQETRSLFLISEHENVVPELMHKQLVQRTHSEFRLTNAQNLDGLA